ncbi:unnamed protein product [Rhizoctonia solani]|uniref:Uncharacterized protein n=1 Tax=Rhizoctonia solani TaxID=456999 RepID=A0A8H2X4D7_9AGAM|nr:unnamed protein product [Rhizoctonia solani]
MLVTRSCIIDPNPSPVSLEDTPLVTPDSSNFPSLGSAVELTTNIPTHTEPTKPYTSLFAPVPKPLPLRPSFGVDLTSPTRRRASDGRLREPSANGEERTKALGTVRKMLEELRVSPDYQPMPSGSMKNGTWTPMDRYIPPWKLQQPRESASNPGVDPSDSSVTKQVPKVNLNDETLDEEQQLVMLKDLEKEETKASVWDSIHEAVRVVEKLEGPNWPSWSFWIQRKVCAANKTVWGHVDGSRPRESSNEWDADEVAIYCALLSSLNFSIIPDQVRTCTTAKEVWDLLELLYKEKPNPESRAVDLMREMTRMNYFEGDDIQRHLHRFERIVDELKEGPYPIPLELAKQFVLGSLPGGLLKHATSIRFKEYASMQELCQDLVILNKQVIVEDRPLETPQRDIGTHLPSDLRYYKYIGDGVLPDGTLYLRAKKTCETCLSFGHKAYASDCPQTEARLGLWGSQNNAQRPWNRTSTNRPDGSEPNRKDSRQALGVDNGRVSRPTSPGSGWGPKRMRTASGGSYRVRTASPGGISARNGHISPTSRIPSEGSGIVGSRSVSGPSAFELDSWR